MTVGPKRLVHAALPMHKLPKIDLILLSHGHMDHLDLPSLEQFDPDIPVIMAANTADIVDDLPFRRVRELDWWGKAHIGDLEIEALRVKHFGWRYPWEQDRSRGNMAGRSFNAYLVTKNGRSFVFGGDTAMQDFFSTIGSRNLTIDLAMMPIGAYDPWIHNHCNPEQAVEMAKMLGAGTVLPMHWGTFIQSDEPAREPIERFLAAASRAGITPALRDIGQTWSLRPESVMSDSRLERTVAR
jgi:L-ascorbate metabolism protein UlaG (beta-lactamase superfamily)